MNREWRAKRKHGTTPLPTQKKFFGFRSIDAKKESGKKENFNVTAVNDILGEIDDNGSWATDYGEETSSDSETAQFSSPENMRCQGKWEISPTEYLSAESLKRHWGNPKYASTRNQCTEDDIQFSDNISTLVTFGSINDDIQFSDNSFPSSIIGKHHCGNPKFTSTRNQCTDEDIHISLNSIPSNIIGMPTERRETIEDSNYQDLENASPQIPVGINENYIKSPGWEDFENEVIREREIPLESAVSDVPHVNTEDLHQVSKLSKEKENLEISSDFLRCMENVFQCQGSQDIYSMTTINTEDIVDDVFKNSKDASSLKLDDAALTIPDNSFEQQETEERSMHELPERSTVTEKKKLNKKRHLGTERSYRKKMQVSNLKHSNQSTRFKAQNSPKLSQITKKGSKSAQSWKDKEEYLRSLPVCPLSLPKTPYADIKRLECPEEETRLTEAGTSKRKKKLFGLKSRVRRRGARNKTLEEEKCNEYEKYLKSVPIDHLSLTKISIL